MRRELEEEFASLDVDAVFEAMGDPEQKRVAIAVEKLIDQMVQEISSDMVPTESGFSLENMSLPTTGIGRVAFGIVCQSMADVAETALTINLADGAEMVFEPQ